MKVYLDSCAIQRPLDTFVVLRNRLEAEAVVGGTDRMINERPLHELTQDAIRILYRELGVMETVRFLRQFTAGYGDYTAEREAIFGQKSLPELLAEIKKRRAAPEAL